MDELRARAYLDLLLGQDSRPRPGQDSGPGVRGDGGNGAECGGTARSAAGAVMEAMGRRPGRWRPRWWWATTAPAGRSGRRRGAGRVRGAGDLDGPAGDAGRAGGPARGAGRDGPDRPVAGPGPGGRRGPEPATTWCVTVTDGQGHAVGHGCARPAPPGRGKPGKRVKPGPPGGVRDGPGFSLTAERREGPPGGYGTWRLRTPGDGPDLRSSSLDPLNTEDCDHRFQASGHDPGVRLRHLAQVRHATCTSPVCRRPREPATSSTTSRTRRAAGRACVMAALSAGMITGSSSSPGGKWTSSPTGRSAGPLPPAASTPPNPPGTRSEPARARLSRPGPGRPRS